MKEILDMIFGDKLSINRDRYRTRCTEVGMYPDGLVRKGWVKSILNGQHYERENFSNDE